MSSTNNGAVGAQDAHSPVGDFNAITFMFRQLLGKVHTFLPVQVVAVTNSGGVAAVGYVDVLPLVNQLDGAGNAVPHSNLHNLPVFRFQGGGNAIILDPQVGDIGVAAFAERDISAVKASKGQNNPGSYRRFDMADGIYFGAILGDVPTQYIEYSAAGIKMFSPAAVIIDAPDVQINAQTVEVIASASAVITAPVVTIDASTSATITTPLFTVNGATVLNGSISQGAGTGGGTATLIGPLTVTNDVTANSTSLHTHQHGGVQTGSGNTGGPI